ncbi:MAG: hypothetical protein ACE141_18580 [Bryobacteraceae bacterium]
MERMLLLLLLWPALLGNSYSDYLSAKRKIDLIGNDQAPAGSKIVLTGTELNAYVSHEVAARVREGLREPRVQLGHGSASGYALVDFPKLRQASGKPMNWLLAKLLEGERPVRVAARIHSERGTARVDVESVEISGMTIEGATLDYLIQKFVLPYYPGAKVGEPFELKHGIERLEIRPAAVQVIIGQR